MNLRIYIFLSVCLIAVTGCQKKPAPVAPPPPVVEVISTSTTDLPVYRNIVATLQGTVNTNIKPRIQGYLLTQDYDDGALVKMGDLLFTIDPAPFEIAVQKAAADVAQAQAQLVKAQIDVERDQALIKADAISQRQLDNAVQAEQAAQAQVEAAQAGLDNAKLNLSYCQVYSPVTGVAGKAQGEIGDLVGSATVLTTISSLDPVQAVFFIPEKAYLERSGDLQKALKIPYEDRPANLELILSSGDTFAQKGRLQFINRQIEEGTGTIGVYALFPNPGSVLRPGQYVKVRGRVNTIPDAILIPQRAVKETQGMFSVFTVNSDNTVSSNTVELGDTQGSNVVISSGLKPKQSVVVEGIQRLKNGVKVQPKPWTKSDNSSLPDDSDPAPASNSSSASPDQKGDSKEGASTKTSSDQDPSKKGSGTSDSSTASSDDK